MGRLLFLAFLLLLVASIVFLCLRPATVTGVNDAELLTSVRDAAEAIDFGGNCRELKEDDWRCTVFDRTGHRGVTAYRVETDSLGCWDATRVGAGPGPDKTSGCITLVDYL